MPKFSSTRPDDGPSPATSAAHRRAPFIAQAKAARQEILESGQGFDADEVHAYLEARAMGQSVPAPTLKTWRNGSRDIDG